MSNRLPYSVPAIGLMTPAIMIALQMVKVQGQCLIWKGFSQDGAYPVFRTKAGPVSMRNRVAKDYAKDALARKNPALARRFLAPRSQFHMTCGNPNCLNPEHIRLWKKMSPEVKRQPRDTAKNVFRSTLSDEEKRSVKQLLEFGKSQKAVAELFGVSQSTISRIANEV